MIEFKYAGPGAANKMRLKLMEICWETFISGAKHFSPSGFTASYIAQRATKEGVDFTLTYSAEYTSYVIQKETHS